VSRLCNEKSRFNAFWALSLITLRFNDQAVKAGDVTSSFRDVHIAIAKDNSPEQPGRVMTSSSRGVCAATAMDGRTVPTVAPIGLMKSDNRVANARHTIPSSRGVCAATAMDGRAVPTVAPIGLMESNVLTAKAQNMISSSRGVCAATAMDGRTVPTVAPIGLMKSILPNSSMLSSSSSQDNRVSQFNATPLLAHNNVPNGQQTKAKKARFRKEESAGTFELLQS
jgi:hypothetical protein